MGALSGVARPEKRSDSSYPLKLGSFQLYVEGFEESSIVLSKLDSLRPLEPELRRAFQLEFEKMTILDYAMRNTDRSMDNWLIHLSWIEESKSDAEPELGRQPSIKSAIQSTRNLNKPKESSYVIAVMLIWPC